MNMVFSRPMLSDTQPIGRVMPFRMRSIESAKVQGDADQAYRRLQREVVRHEQAVRSPSAHQPTQHNVHHPEDRRCHHFERRVVAS